MLKRMRKPVQERILWVWSRDCLIKAISQLSWQTPGAIVQDSGRMQRGLRCLPDLAHLRITLLGGFHSLHSLWAPQLCQELLQWPREGVGCAQQSLGDMTASTHFKGQGLSPGPRTPNLENHSGDRAAWSFGAPTRAGRTMGPLGLEGRAQSHRGLFLSLYGISAGGIWTFFFPLSPTWNGNVSPVPVLPLYFGST